MEAPDSAPARLPVTEKLVARLWDDQRPFALPLATTDGEEIQVVYRGRRRWDRGPDFAGALIARRGSELCSGDIEVHVHSSDWRAHGHHRDPFYNRVILQVVLWDDAADPATREDGAPVPLVALAPRLLASLETLIAAPQPADPLPSPCRRLASPGSLPLAALLERGGLERFAAKAARFESDLTCIEPDQVRYQSIATALGYSQNRPPFLRLAALIPLEALTAFRASCETGRQGDMETLATDSALTTQNSEPAAAEALLLGAAGLLPSQRGLATDEDDEYARTLEKRWAAESGSWAAGGLRAADWEFFRVRPANFPTRRIAALARLVDRWPPGGLAESLAELAGTSPPKALPRALEGLLRAGDRDGYWALHCDFGRRLTRPGVLLGRQRAAEIAVNVFLPFLAARADQAGDGALGQRVLEAYRLYPKRGDNELSRYVATQLTGIPRPREARSACRQQGLLHLYWGYCETKRCGECPAGGQPGATFEEKVERYELYGRDAPERESPSREGSSGK